MLKYLFWDSKVRLISAVDVQISITNVQKTQISSFNLSRKIVQMLLTYSLVLRDYCGLGKQNSVLFENIMNFLHRVNVINLF